METAEFLDSWFMRLFAGGLGTVFGWVLVNASSIIQILTIVYLIFMIINCIVGIIEKMGKDSNDDKEDGRGA